MERIKYPKARRDETKVDEYHGYKICDPYSWLEDPDAQETKEFVQKQNEISAPFLKECKFKEKFKKRCL